MAPVCKSSASIWIPRLSNEQRVVYQQLMADSRTLVVQGQQVILASVEAESLTDEISSIAHKMREVLDPDGLFILVSTGEGIRIVARSISDKVNVARILSKFGGGGHDRAASCLIHPLMYPIRRIVQAS